MKFYNDREKAKVGVYKVDRETGKYLAGAVFNLYTADDIYSVDGKLLFAAGELVATSPETGADGYTYFDCDIPIRGEYYGSSIRKDATTNSGNYIVKELRAPLGYYVNEEPMEVTFTYDGQAIMVLDNTCSNKPTEMWVSKRDLTNDEELPGATLAIKDMDGNIVTTWVSTDEPHRVTGLHFGESYTLTEIPLFPFYQRKGVLTRKNAEFYSMPCGEVDKMPPTCYFKTTNARNGKSSAGRPAQRVRHS